jgi:hypothetical protein
MQLYDWMESNTWCYIGIKLATFDDGNLVFGILLRVLSLQITVTKSIQMRPRSILH